MRKFAHRGNINGPNYETENSPLAVELAIQQGYDCEVDLWVLDGRLYFGHDGPKYSVTVPFLIRNSGGILFHAKNPEALSYCLDHNMHCFFHQYDDYTMTNQGIPICYPNRTYFNNCLLMLSENFAEIDTIKLYGICSDFIGYY
jgi:hypothetical protein